LEPGAIELKELMMHWGMSPGSDPNSDREMQAFLALARSKRPEGGGEWVTPESGTAVLAENRLGEWEVQQTVRPPARRWWQFWL
jgi:hypothetical protein